MLVGNYAVLSKDPGRSIGGGATGLGCNRSDFAKSSLRRAAFTAYGAKASIPDGCRPPYAWVLPKTAGGLASRNIISGGATFTGAGALGRNIAAALTGEGGMAGTGGLITQAVAALSGSGTVTSANLLAILQAAAALSGSGTVGDANLTAEGWVAAALVGAALVAPTIRATGELTADVSPFTELSPENLASAVWSGAQGRLISAILRNRVVTDPDTGVMTVYDDDGVTPLLTASIYEDAAGTLPYNGSGVNLRERFEE